MVKGETCQTKRYNDFVKSCLSDTEKKEVMNMLYKYKHGFSLRDEVHV